ncbi:hypothetical protein Ancab_034266 [Ancistrocladus abbreviatus]
MKAIKAWVLILTSVFIYCPIFVSPSFDYLKLSVQWSPAYCNNYLGYCDKNKVVDNFNIHGLWPSNFSNPQPEYCRTSTIDPTKLQRMQTTLTHIWKNLERGKPDSKFWGYEWTKHGTCMTQDQVAYFQLVIDLYKNYVFTLYPKLINMGVEANATSPYPLQKLNADLKGLLNGNTPEITCTRWQSSSTQLAEIRICFSNNGPTIMNCLTSGNSCKKDVYLLPSTTVKLMG